MSKTMWKILRKRGINNVPVRKISRSRKTSSRLNIEVDGGINPLTAKKCVKAGANLLVVGSYLENERFEERLLELRKAIQ